MNVITQEVLSDRNIPIYILAYFKAHNLKEGDDWSALDYIHWILDKQKEFHEVKKLQDDTTYWKGHNDALFNEFLKFIGFNK